MSETEQPRAPTASQASSSFHLSRAREYVELHDQVRTSVNLLDSLETFLSTFQKDLSAVSGQISDLQDRSKDIENRLKSRRKIEKPLSNLITDIIIPPHLAALILDSEVGEHWILGIEDFERRLETAKHRTRVKAARDLGEVIEGLRIVAATKLRAFFLALFQPIRSNVTTNMQVMQTSVLIKFRPLFSFLQRQAPTVANEVQRSYVGAARLYYETGFRRYARSLGWVKTRTLEKLETIVVNGDTTSDPDRLAYAKLEGPPVTLAFLADDKNFKAPLEALVRSLLLVFMDNSTAEYTFISTFFTSEPLFDTKEETEALSPMLLSPGVASRRLSVAGSELGGPARHRHRASSVISANGMQSLASLAASVKEEQASMDAIWKQIMDPVTEYIQSFVATALEPMPPTVPLLTIIRLTECIMEEVQKRGCPPAESFVFTLRLKMWPIFQKEMADHVEALKRLAEGATAGYFSRAVATTDALVATISQRYTAMFNSFVTLTDQAEETMIFSNLLRLRQELLRLIARHTEQNQDPITKATAQSAIYEQLLQGLSGAANLGAHPKSQQEIAFWSNLDEEAGRKIASRNQQRTAGGK